MLIEFHEDAKANGYYLTSDIINFSCTKTPVSGKKSCMGKNLTNYDAEHPFAFVTTQL